MIFITLATLSPVTDRNHPVYCTISVTSGNSNSIFARQTHKMYPGTASSKSIPAKSIKAMYFKDELQSNNLKPSSSIPAVNISKTAFNYVIVIAAPGLHREDFCIEVNNAIITIAAQKVASGYDPANDRCEYDYTDWARAFTLPEDADGLLTNAEYQNGELVIQIPRNTLADNVSQTMIYVY